MALVQIGEPRVEDVPAAYQKKLVIGCWPDKDGVGYEVRLQCCHTIWMLKTPDRYAMYCGACLAEMLRSEQEVAQ